MSIRYKVGVDQEWSGVTAISGRCGPCPGMGNQESAFGQDEFGHGQHEAASEKREISERMVSRRAPGETRCEPAGCWP